MVIEDGIPGWYYCQPFFKKAVQSAPDGALFVEAGVLFGSASNGLAGFIRDSGKQIKLTLVDAFKYENLGHKAKAVMVELGVPASDEGFRAAFEAFRKGKAHQDADVVVGESPDVSQTFSDGSINMLMLDNNHTESHLHAEIAAWSSKVSPNGILACKVAGWLDGKLNQHEGVQKALTSAFGDRVEKFDDIVWFVANPGNREIGAGPANAEDPTQPQIPPPPTPGGQG